MNYENIYNNLVEKSYNRILPENVFTNKHHIIPVHMGGIDHISNICVLTYKEHVLAHKLLYEIYGSKYDLYAYLLMLSKNEEASRVLKSMGGKASYEKRKNDGTWEKVRLKGSSALGKITGKRNVESGFLKKIAIENADLGALCSSYSRHKAFIDQDGDVYLSLNDISAAYPDEPKGRIAKWCATRRNGFDKRDKTLQEENESRMIIENIKRLDRARKK